MTALNPEQIGAALAAVREEERKMARNIEAAILRVLIESKLAPDAIRLSYRPITTLSKMGPGMSNQLSVEVTL